jgi:hypothetical protein
MPVRRTPLTIAAVAFVATLAGALPAATTAHEYCVPHGEDVGCTRDNGVPHYWLDGCDREPDGNQVRTNFKYSGFDTLYRGSWDDNGANPGCANNYVYHEIHPIAWHRVCEEDISCGHVEPH